MWIPTCDGRINLLHLEDPSEAVHFEGEPFFWLDESLLWQAAIDGTIPWEEISRKGTKASGEIAGELSRFARLTHVLGELTFGLKSNDAETIAIAQGIVKITNAFPIASPHRGLVFCNHSLASRLVRFACRRGVVLLLS